MATDQWALEEQSAEVPNGWAGSRLGAERKRARRKPTVDNEGPWLYHKSSRLFFSLFWKLFPPLEDYWRWTICVVTRDWLVSCVSLFVLLNPQNTSVGSIAVSRWLCRILFKAAALVLCFSAPSWWVKVVLILRRYKSGSVSPARDGVFAFIFLSRLRLC